MNLNYRGAWEDVALGLTSWHLWGRLGWQEVKRRYRRTVIGPFWATLSLGIFIFAFGLVGSQLWSQTVSTFLPFFSAGMIVWTLVSTIITESCSAYIGGEGLIKQMRLSYTMLVCAVVWRNLIVFAHNLILFVIVAVVFGVPFVPATLLAVPGLLLVCLNGLWVGIFFGTMCARYRDLQQLVASFLTVMMFITPIMWPPGQISKGRAFLIDWNVLHHVIDIIRSPLLGQMPAPESWLIVAGLTLGGWTATFLLYAMFRRRIAYWL
jgi:ABC-type polysaccharide/polyol phosphate export permease